MVYIYAYGKEDILNLVGVTLLGQSLSFCYFGYHAVAYQCTPMLV